MAWELQSHMHSYVQPTISKHAGEGPERLSQLAAWYADQRWDPDSGDEGYDILEAKAKTFADDVLIEAIASHAIEEGSTTNGGHEIYLDDWTSLEWCSDEEQEAWGQL